MGQLALIPLFLFALFVTSCAPIAAWAQTAPTAFPPITATPFTGSGHTVYVIDPREGEVLTQILVIDADRQRVMRTFRTRFTPEVAFTPDGKRMYVTDSYQSRVIRGESHDVLSVYDAQTGDLLHDDVEIPKRLLYKGFPNAYPFTFLSRDGRRLFVSQYGDPDVHAMRITVLDALTFATLAMYPHPDCTLLPLKDGRLICVGQGGTLRFVDPLTGNTEPIADPIPTEPALESPASAWALSANDRLYRVRFDTPTQAHVRITDLTANPPQIVADNIALDIPQKSFDGINRIVLSPDESRLYIVLAIGDYIDQYTPTEVWAFDIKTWTRAGVFKTADPAWHIAMSQDGKQLYSVNPFKKSLFVFDTTSFQEIGSMRDLGDSPALVIVPPQ